MIKPHELTIDRISSILENAAIDHNLEPDGQVYVTELRFNFWIDLNSEKSRLTFFTHWDFLGEISELEALRCANANNLNLIDLQFFIGDDLRCLRSCQVISFRYGLNPIEFVRSARSFAEIFDAAISDPAHAHLFEPRSASVLDDEDERTCAGSKVLH